MIHSVEKITAEHLKREAYLYIRQSSLKQVIENTESTKRQYALVERAIALGWSREQVVVIDSDLGESAAAGAADRAGFERLMTDVSMGRAGLVMGLEVSRLARSCSAWHRLLEICALSQTLVLEQDGLYDVGHINDRLLLGLKAAMSEAELHLIRERMRGGALSKAARGELRRRLPVGFVYDEQNRVVFDPDRQVSEAVYLLFQSFRRLGSAFKTAQHFREQGLKFPKRIHCGPNKGECVEPLDPGAGDAGVAQPTLCRGLCVWPLADQEGAAGPVDRPRLAAGAVARADPGGAPGLHHLGGLPAQPPATAKEHPEPEWESAPAAGGFGALTGVGRVRVVRAEDVGALLPAAGRLAPQLCV